MSDPTTPSGPPGRDENALWEEIVANYGDRELPETPLVVPPPPEAVTPPPVETDDDHFVPPVPPPLPRPTPDRMLAWVGVLGAPLLALVFVLLRWTPPSWVVLFMALGFLGGTGWLIATMGRDGDHRDGWDDGAVV